MTTEYVLTSDEIALLKSDTEGGTANFLTGYNDIESFIIAPDPGQDTSQLDKATK